MCPWRTVQYTSTITVNRDNDVQGPTANVFTKVVVRRPATRRLYVTLYVMLYVTLYVTLPPRRRRSARIGRGTMARVGALYHKIRKHKESVEFTLHLPYVFYILL